MNEIRDFIYLDQKRVLSFGSQLLGGLADTITTISENSKDKIKDLDLKGNINAEAKLGENSLALIESLISIIGKANLGVSGEINPHFTSKTFNKEEKQESKLLDHFQFTLLRNALLEQKILKNLDDKKAHEWNNGKAAKDIEFGDFIELTSRVKFFDVSHLKSIASGLEKFIEMTDQITTAKKIHKMIQEGTSAEEAMEYINKNAMQMGYHSRMNTFGNDLNPLELNAMIDLMKDISEGGYASVPIHIIARPLSASDNDTNFVAPIKEEYLIDSKEEILFKYGHEPNQNWKILGQICKKPKKKHTNKMNIKSPNFSEANKLNDFIKEITNTFTEIGSQIGIQSFVEYPNISINLIAIYR
ncbi:DUF6414 family protein [Halanaerobium salsuginis]|uniref:Uncharacterized protein n=1 Tax=Halanaerobium salsuginis TaxID=29563 RepID=A0A1I4NJQ4_9FIRM|nr:hypothetical protein [Halanaerobium salsuginis]SFM15744.1 hypothetical protein SAMN02983006_02916 [Halanaerobium salsuginis]